MKIFLDIDGVLADFHTAALAAHGKTQDDLPNTTGPEAWGIDESIYPRNPRKFWEPFEEEFWANLPLCPGAHELTSRCIFYGDTYFATCPSRNDGCLPGKQAWIKKHFPFFQSRTFYCPTGKKHLLCDGKRSCVLIDDHQAHVDIWRECGGSAIIVPRRWNNAWELEGKIALVAAVSSALERLANGTDLIDS